MDFEIPRRLWTLLACILVSGVCSASLGAAASAENIWLAAQAPYPPAGDPGRPDFMDLFNARAPWPETSRVVKVVQLPTQFMAWVPDGQLRIIIDDLNRRGISLGIESLAQNGDNEPRCGQRVEGYGHPKEVAAIAAKIQRVGGTLAYLAMDEPLTFGHFFNGPTACHSSVADVAERVAEVLGEYRRVFPNVIIGDIEPGGAFRSPEWNADYRQWVIDFREKVGTPLSFLRLDIDWNDGDPRQAVDEGIALARDNGLKLQIIYNGRDTDKSDQAWIESAKANIKLVESRLGGAADTVVFQSWAPHPTYLLPETSPTTLTGLLAWYLRSSGHR